MKHASLMLKYLPILFLVVALESACHHEVAKNQPNSTPPAAAPTAAISANPPYIQHGQSTTLSWQTANASEINIQGLGSVPASGSRTLYPAESTTYELVAKGSGGEGTASARVTVNSAVSSSGNSGESDPGFLASVNDAFFDYDRFNIRPDAMSQIEHQCDGGRSLRRARLSGIQPRSWRQASGRGSKSSGPAWRAQRPHQDGQLWQGKAILFRLQRTVLAGKSSGARSRTAVACGRSVPGGGMLHAAPAWQRQGRRDYSILSSSLRIIASTMGRTISLEIFSMM